jgi:hypothetical protein
METTGNLSLISYCGLYCANCRKYLKGTCPGCKDNVKATWCKIRTCNMEHSYKSCADCTEFSNPMECKKFNNVVSKIFSLLFRSDRAASIEMIKARGYEGFADYMVQNKLMVIKK